MWELLIYPILFVSFVENVYSNDLVSIDSVRWCVTNQKEMNKCVNMQQAFREIKYPISLECVKGDNKDDCMYQIEMKNADLLSLDAGEVYIGGRFHSLIPIMMESSDENNLTPFYYSVAVVRKNLPVRSLWDLRGKRLCSPGAMQMAGWIIPIANLLQSRTMEIFDCNNHVKSAAYFFGPSCVPGVLDSKHNPIGDNPSSLCDQCRTGYSNKLWCTDNDPYAGYAGALQCISDNRGDIAFVKHTSISEKLRMPNNTFREMDFELLCADGSRRPLSSVEKSPQTCSWGKVPMPAIVTVSSKSYETRKKYQAMFFDGSNVFGPQSSTNVNFRMFESFQFGDANLLFLDSTRRLVPIPEKMQTFETFIGAEYYNYIKTLHKCSVDFIRLCVISDSELEKCNNMQMAFSARGLQPKLMCIMTRSQQECMALIRDNNADTIVLDSGDVFRGGRYYNMIPIMAEIYDRDKPFYYAVAAVKKMDKDTSLLELKGKRSCHGGVAFSAGWSIPLTFMINHGRMRCSGCKNVVWAASEFFQKSCAPGVLSSEYNRAGFSMSNLCDLCIGIGEHYCSRDHSEPYFGYTGAFQCLAEGGGDVAFVKHTTVLENTDGKKADIWARNLISDDYELLCRDGTRKNVDKYEECNLAVVPTNALMTSAHKNETEIAAITNLFFYSQHFFGSKENDDFKVFQSPSGYSDLIFQDSTTQLHVIDRDRRNYYDYLGQDYIRMIDKVDCFGGCSNIFLSVTLLILSFIMNIAL